MAPFLDGFEWPIPARYREAFGICQFNSGDTFFDAKECYDNSSEERPPSYKKITVIEAPSKEPTTSKATPIEAFRRNWGRECKIEITDHTEGARGLSITQGHLLSVVAEGKIGLFQTSSLDVPLLCDDAMQQLDLSTRDTFALCDFKAPNVIHLIADTLHPHTLDRVATIQQELSMQFQVFATETSLHGERGKNGKPFFASLVLCTLTVDSKASERVRDVVKKHCFATHLLSEPHRKFRIRDFAVFTNFKAKNKEGIEQFTFAHGAGRFYRFQLARRKLALVPRGASTFLDTVTEDCPNHIFASGPKASRPEWQFTIPRVPATHLIVELAKEGLARQSSKSAHERIANFLIATDSNTIACEVPVWLEPGDYLNYASIFATQQCITGHIDIIRMEPDGALMLWDFKPGAQKETKASTQLLLYALMFSRRAGTPLQQLRCGYFDTECCFVFEPREVLTGLRFPADGQEQDAPNYSTVAPPVRFM